MQTSAVLLIVVAACGGTRYRTERFDLVGHGNGTPSTDVAGAGGVQLPQGNYELAMRFDVPRAQVVEWKLVCPGVDLDGQVGESLERYRERRVAELARERERAAARAEAAANLVVGSIARVELHAAGPIVLAPDDIGRGTLVSTARVITAGDGVCALQVNAPDPEVRASFTVTRIRDLDAEQRMRTIASREVAVHARTNLTAQLVTAGAVPAVQPAPAPARVDHHARAEARAIYARQEYILYLTGKCDADPARSARSAEAERIRREARLMADAQLAQRRDQAALRARDDIRAQLLAVGAKPRPPMPAPKPEEPGTAPFDGAEWITGYWAWQSGDWAWHDGSWVDPDEFDYGYYAPDVASVRRHEDDNYVAPLPGVRDHRRPRERNRDHREASESSRSWLGDAASKGSSKPDEPKVRDHRSDDRRVWVPKDADGDKDDDKPIVRDHRR